MGALASPPMTTYPLSDTDREIQERTRRFVDEDLIPWELHAEEHGGKIPEEEHRRHEERARELGLSGMNLPKDLGGGGFTTLQQVLVSEQIGRVTNALGWCVHTPAEWAPEVMTAEQIERWLKPAIRGERSECYAITEEGAGSDVDAIEATATPRRRRLRARRREDARDVVQPRRSHLLPGEAHRRRARGRARAVRGRQGHARASGSYASPLHAHATPTRTRSSRSTTSGCRRRS